MWLHQIDIRNFRGIKFISILLGKFLVLIGENNTGKSSIIDAIKICMTGDLTRLSEIFENFDYHLKDSISDPASAEPIEITLTFKEQEGVELSEDFRSEFSRVVIRDAQNLRTIVFRITSKFDKMSKRYKTELLFLDEHGEQISGLFESDLMTKLRKQVPTFYLESLRDVTREFQPKTRFWGHFVRALDIDDKTKRQIEINLKELNDAVLENHPDFGVIEDRLAEVAKLLSLGSDNPISIEAIPSKFFDLLSKTQVSMTSQTGARIPILRHGSGIQSLTVISLFDAFMRSQLTVDHQENSIPVLLMEEPEAHLHPSAAISIGGLLESLSGQIIITTHSGDLLADIDFENICRLVRKGNEIVKYQLTPGSITDEMRRAMNYHIRRSRGRVLFSRCWLLVEGETEVTILSEASRAMGLNLNAEGVSIIEYSRSKLNYFISLADQLGIEWFMLADNDHDGRTKAETAKGMLENRQFSDHIQILEDGHMELFLCMNGFGGLYEETVKKDYILPTVELKDISYWTEILDNQRRKSKVDNAVLVANSIENEGESVAPELLKRVIQQSVSLARGS